MVRRLTVTVFVVLLAGRVTGSTNDTTDEMIDATESADPQETEPEVDTTDLEVRNILIDISNGIFEPNDEELISLIKRGIVEAAESDSATMKSSIEAGARMAQRFVTETTAAYTAAIFQAHTAQDAQKILLRFQDTVQQIVDYAKSLNFTTQSI